MYRSNGIKVGLALVAVLLSSGCKAVPADDGEIISRDVAVIGGGASGSHAAVWLRDHGYSVVVVEKADHLGGHTSFYDDPETGNTINVGVQAWIEYKDAFDFTDRMNVSSDGSMQFTPVQDKFIDFKTGLPVPDYVTPADDEKYPALQRYLDILEKYEDMLLPGFFNFPEPDEIPEDLLMSFGEFVRKYDIGFAAPQVWDATAQGLGDTMSTPTIYVMQACGAPMVRALLGIGAAAVPSSGRLYDLFDSISNFLGDDVLYSSMVVSAERDIAEGITLKVRGPNGSEPTIKAKRLLIAFEPTEESMSPFDPDEKENEVFSKFEYSNVYAGILQHPSLEASTAYSHRLAETTPSNFTVFPVAPQLGRVNYLGGTKNLFEFTAVGTEEDTVDTMLALITSSVDNMIGSGTIPASNGSIIFSAFADHGKMHARVTADELRDGFIQKQLGLQGHRSTWYTGAAFSAGFSTVLWEYNKVLLPSMVDEL